MGKSSTLTRLRKRIVPSITIVSVAVMKFDLKKNFDTCEEEVTYKGYRADLMLSSMEHPEREPIFFEISVTHDCEVEKLASEKMFYAVIVRRII